MAKTKVLITVTTYPLPSRSHDELICTAGILEDGSWIRIYPVPFKFLTGLRSDGKISSYKFTWIELELVKRTDDFRPESHSPKDYTFSDMVVHEHIAIKGNESSRHKAWTLRKELCTQNVYYNLTKLISDSKAPQNVSLATFKPTKLLDFIIEDDDREWKAEWKEQLKQLDLFSSSEGVGGQRKLIKKIPYKFYYKFEDDEGKSSKLMIEDWEIGQLYFNCLRAYETEEAALKKVREKYWDAFIKKDIHLFLGTTKQWHSRRSNNPFVIIGVFYPPIIGATVSKSTQLELF